MLSKRASFQTRKEEWSKRYSKQEIAAADSTGSLGASRIADCRVAPAGRPAKRTNGVRRRKAVNRLTPARDTRAASSVQPGRSRNGQGVWSGTAVSKASETKGTLGDSRPDAGRVRGGMIVRETILDLLDLRPRMQERLAHHGIEMLPRFRADQVESLVRARCALL